MTFSLRTLVAKAKSRILALPMMQSTLLPGIMAFTTEVSKPRMLCLKMLAPASPKPRANSDPSLMIVFSRMTVSKASTLPFRAGVTALDSASHRSCSQASLDFFCFSCLYFWNSSSSNSLSAMFIAINGSLAMILTFSTILSTGFKTRAFASLEKKSVLMQSVTQMKPVVNSRNNASVRTKGLKSKKKAKCQLSYCAFVMSCGWTRILSPGRKSLGQPTPYLTASISGVRSETPKWSSPPKVHHRFQGAASNERASQGRLPTS
mmetsp:Transcript_11898/g.32641  ORF Transcript_11898/g.32641 Transcript_11898/m.32641 type:complete len:263 (-) Transcript_11898:1726-2514(-)